MARAAVRELKSGNLQSEITVINTATGEYAIVADIVSDAVVWRPARGRQMFSSDRRGAV